MQSPAATLFFWTAVSFVLTLIYCSFVEWWVHARLMHRDTPLSRRPFALHALVHHRIFGPGPSYTTGEEEAASHIVFPVRDSLALIAGNGVVVMAVQWLTGAPVLAGGVLALVAYLVAMNGLHYCFHVPRGRFFESQAWFRWLATHHRVHHARHDRNLNLVLPIADVVLGTGGQMPTSSRAAPSGMRSPPGVGRARRSRWSRRTD